MIDYASHYKLRNEGELRRGVSSPDELSLTKINKKVTVE